MIDEIYSGETWTYFPDIETHNLDLVISSSVPEVFIFSNSFSLSDSDGDGIPNEEDLCPETIEEQIIYGCSCSQILDIKPGKDKGRFKNGCSKGIIDTFSKKIGWAKDLN